MTKTQKSFLGGAAILAGAGLVVKIIGAGFRLVLAAKIGTEGMGIFGLAYPIYAFLLVVSTAGLPVAVSRMVSAQTALGNYRNAHKIFITSMKLLVGLGIVTSVILFAGSGLISSMQGNVKSIYVLQGIAPALFLVSVISAYRGYFQGMQVMMPTAFSQVVEQVGKLVIGLALGIAWVSKGPEFGALGGILGVTLSEVMALVLLMGVYMGKRKGIMDRVKSSPETGVGSAKSILAEIIKIAIPVTIGASVMPLVNFADQMLVLNRLKPIMDMVSGIPQEVLASKTGTQLATSLYGLLTSVCNPLVNFPAFISLALGVSLVPAISEAVALKDRKKVTRTVSTGIRMTMLLGLPSAVGLMTLAYPIIKVLFGAYAEWEITFGSWILSLLAVGIIFLSLVQSLTAILQGAGKVMLPVRNLLIGAVFKVVITYVLVGQPGWNIRGAAMGTVICYAIAAILNLIGVIRYTGVAFSLRDFILKPVAATGVMGLAVWGVRAFISARTGSWGMTLVLAMVAGIVVYGIMLFVVRAMTKEDIDMIPGLNKIAERFRKGRQG